MTREARIVARVGEIGALPLMRSAAVTHSATCAEIAGKCRDRSLVRARHAFWSELHRTGMSVYRIARVCEVDHSSVAHALGKARSCPK